MRAITFRPMGDAGLATELQARGIRDARVLRAIASIARSDFVRPDDLDQAIDDHPLPIGYGQTISQPYMVAFMSQALGLAGDERVFEVGTGSGYQTAILAQLCREVYSVEVVPALAARARQHFLSPPCSKVFLRCGDGTLGWPEAAPFDRIILTAAPSEIPPALVTQLARGGLLLAPVGTPNASQDLIRISKDADDHLHWEKLLSVQFVPITRPTPWA